MFGQNLPNNDLLFCPLSKIHNHLQKVWSCVVDFLADRLYTTGKGAVLRLSLVGHQISLLLGQIIHNYRRNIESFQSRILQTIRVGYS